MTSVPVERTTRPWGHYIVLGGQTDHQVKRIVVAPGKRPSYQRHQYRAEHWFIVAGDGKVTIDDEVRSVTAGDSVEVALGAAHRIENVGERDLVFIEIQHGSYFGEDDIIRVEDDFGRAGARDNDGS
jgi:mannose-6-phosphate isomerase-like protein (cupin superfamily)